MNPTIFQDPATRKDLERLSRLQDEQLHRKLMSWLIGDDTRRWHLAVDVFARGGKAGMSLLWRTALFRDRGAKQRVRLLNAIERIGWPSNLMEWFELFSTKYPYGRQAHKQILRLLEKCRPTAP